MSFGTLGSLGGGFGRLGSSGGAAKVAKPHGALCEAIEKREILRAKHRGLGILFEPYAVFDTEQDGLLLTAIVLDADDKSLNSFSPQDLKVADISGQELVGIPFIPSAAFDPSAPIYAGRTLKCVVKFS